MPYSTSTSADDCDGVAVVKDDTGEVMGCHPSEEAAQEQIAAIEASESGDGRAISDIDLSVPDYMQAAAQAALDAAEDGLIPGSCGSGRGQERAQQIAEDRLQPADFVSRDRGTPIPAYLTSHAEDVTAEGAPSSWTEEEWSDCGNAQYARWGGDASGRALEWAQGKANEIAREQDAELPYPERAMSMDVREMSTDEIDALLTEYLQRSARASPDELSEDMLVEWQSADDMAYGRIVTVETEGTIEAEPEGPAMEGTEDEPAYMVQVYEPGEDEWQPTDVFVVHRAEALTPIDAFPEPEGRGGYSDDSDEEGEPMRVFCGRALDPDMVKQGVWAYLDKNEQDAPYCWFKELYVESVDGDRATGYAIIEKVAQCWKARWTYEPGSFMMQPKDSWVKVAADYKEMDGMQEVGGMDAQEVPDAPEENAPRAMQRRIGAMAAPIEQKTPEGGQRCTGTWGIQQRGPSKDNVSTFLIATEGIARDGMVLRLDGGDLSGYKNNSVVLWMHGADPNRGSLPVARAINIIRKEAGLLVQVEWYDDPFSQLIRDMVDREYLNAASISWYTKEGGVTHEEIDGRRVPVVIDWEMTEFSVVAVGADQDALVTERAYDGDLMAMISDLKAMHNDLKAWGVDEAGIIEAIRELVQEEYEALAGTPADDTDRSGTLEAPTRGADGDGTPSPGPQAGSDAWSIDDLTPTQERAVLDQIDAYITTSLKRRLGQE